MKSISILTVALFVALCACAFAGGGNDMPSGQHYNLNIIGTSNSHDVGDSQGHTLFVLLDGKTRIYMTQNPGGEFEVVDRDGTDGRAEFNIAPGHYDVYARALGRPGGGVHIESWGEFEDDTGTPVLKLGEIDISRVKGKPQTVSLNRLFYVDVTLVVNGQTVEYRNTWIFDIEELLAYYWEYYNNNLKLLQVRFYPRAD